MATSFLVMGVSGCGKSTIARMLSQTLDIPFIEADDYHPPANINKMQNGQPLQDEDRWPWLQNIAATLQQHEATGSVLACSALKESYRTVLNSLIAHPLQIIFLEGNFDTIHRRMQARAEHFMPAKLLQSQFDTLEPPTLVWTFSIEDNPETIFSQIIKKINHHNQHG